MIDTGSKLSGYEKEAKKSSVSGNDLSFSADEFEAAKSAASQAHVFADTMIKSHAMFGKVAV